MSLEASGSGEGCEHFTTLRGDPIADEFKRILDDYVESHYPARTREAEPAGV